VSDAPYYSITLLCSILNYLNNTTVFFSLLKTNLFLEQLESEPGPDDYIYGYISTELQIKRQDLLTGK
jgi:hypothetical protein